MAALLICKPKLVSAVPAAAWSITSPLLIAVPFEEPVALIYAPTTVGVPASALWVKVGVHQSPGIILTPSVAVALSISISKPYIVLFDVEAPVLSKST